MWRMPYVVELDGAATDEQRAALAQAIGRVAMRSASSDDTLRFLMADLAETNDPGWMIFEGQSTDWLINQSQALLKAAEGQSAGTPFDSELKAALGKVAGVAKLRNEIVHGLWTTASNFDDSECKPRPFGNIPSKELLWYCHRSRYYRFEAPSRWTASDVNRVSDQIEEYRREAATVFARRLASLSEDGEVMHVWAEYI